MQPIKGEPDSGSEPAETRLDDAAVIQETATLNEQPGGPGLHGQQFGLFGIEQHCPQPLKCADWTIAGLFQRRV